MKPYALIPYPMTPPDDPPEPPLGDALPCLCGYMPTWEFKSRTECRLRCDLNCVQGWWAETTSKAIEWWNYAVDDAKGEQLKAQGQALVDYNNYEWMQNVLAVIENHARWTDTFTIEHVRQFCNLRGLPEPAHPNAWGAAFSAAAKQGLIARVGYQKNKLPSAHARVVAVWKGKS